MLRDHRVAGVVAALGADYEAGPLGEVVGDLALTFVSPLSTDDYYDHRSGSHPGRNSSRA
jgi:hypothetical protein